MPTLKEYNVKLTRLRSTRKLTRTMKLVSVTKLRRAQEAEKRASRFIAKIRAIAARLSTAGVEAEHPLLTPRPNAKTVLVLVVTADRGLCGGFNSAVLKAVMEWSRGQEARGRRVLMSCCGRRGYSYLKGRTEIERYYEDVVARPSFEQASRIGHEVQGAFLGKRIDEVYVAWNAASGLVGYEPKIERLAPLPPVPAAPSDAAPDGGSWLLEPEKGHLLEVVLPWLLNLTVYASLLSSASGEHGARMRAMDQASTNADNLIRQITLRRNRARQAAITTELTEIVAGAEALR
jgi:F-type H+-transporting ATPase subunit gamma